MISIVIVVYNDNARLNETLQSLLKWSFDGVVVIQDGCENSSALLVVNKYIGALNIDYKSERDYGIYDAMNKAINRVTTSWFFHLNCGDILIRTFDLKLDELHAVNVVFMSVQVHWRDSDKTVIYPVRLQDMNYSMATCHQGILIRTSFSKSMLYNLNYVIAADYEFVNRILRLPGCTFTVLNLKSPFVSFQGDEGFSDRFRFKLEFETWLIRQKYVNSIAMKAYILFEHSLRYLKFKLL